MEQDSTATGGLADQSEELRALRSHPPSAHPSQKCTSRSDTRLLPERTPRTRARMHERTRANAHMQLHARTHPRTHPRMQDPVRRAVLAVVSHLVSHPRECACASLWLRVCTRPLQPSVPHRTRVTPFRQFSFGRCVPQDRSQRAQARAAARDAAPQTGAAGAAARSPTAGTPMHNAPLRPTAVPRGDSARTASQALGELPEHWPAHRVAAQALPRPASAPPARAACLRSPPACPRAAAALNRKEKPGAAAGSACRLTQTLDGFASARRSSSRCG
jgi:hypothetical protein